MSQTQRKPDVGIGYKSTYKDKDGNEQGYLKLLIRVEELNQLAQEDGMIKLSVFPQMGVKKKANSPDFTVKPTLSKAKSGGANTHGRANVANTAAATGSKFPF